MIGAEEKESEVRDYLDRDKLEKLARLEGRFKVEFLGSEILAYREHSILTGPEMGEITQFGRAIIKAVS